jgi:alkylation response protein AidB-like acyl-CoA dehydrogenase
MVLTEPDAGSDVGSARTRAVDQHDGTWHIEGVKRFITSGDSDDLFENIAHLVLARPVGAPPGQQRAELVPGAQVSVRPADRCTKGTATGYSPPPWSTRWG